MGNTLVWDQEVLDPTVEKTMNTKTLHIPDLLSQETEF